MEAQDTERIVVAKPVASRPSCSSLNSFGGLLSGGISASTPSSFSDTAVAAIRPKTVRINSAIINRNSLEIVSSQGYVSGTACCPSEKILNPEIKSTVVYKPMAKLVSSKTVQLLANLENFDIAHQYAVPQVGSQGQHAGHPNQHLQAQLTSNLYGKPPPHVKTYQTSESSSHAALQNLEESQRAQLSTASGDRPSYDGYNWRKYGQKQVKGSEYPRSYYKCTHPNCPVKKKVERSYDGQIAEIVYKGEHDHLKPQPPKRHSSGLQEQGFASDANGQETGNPSWSNARSEGSERRVVSKYESRPSASHSFSDKATNAYDSLMLGAFHSGVGISENSCGLTGDYDEGSRGVYVEDDASRYKRRKNDSEPNEVGKQGQGAQDPDIVVQSARDSEVCGDGFRWRKYGQKVVKGNPYPRSYYRCTSIKCNVRKHVERAMDDPSAFITTYEGKHNHDMPTIGNLNPIASDPGSASLQSNKGTQ